LRGCALWRDCAHRQAASVNTQYAKRFPDIQAKFFPDIQATPVVAAAAAPPAPASKPPLNIKTILLPPAPPPAAASKPVAESEEAGPQRGMRHHVKDGVVSLADLYAVIYNLNNRDQTSRKLNYQQNQKKLPELLELVKHTRRYDFNASTWSRSSSEGKHQTHPLVVTSRSQLLQACELNLRDEKKPEERSAMRGRVRELLRSFDQRYPGMWKHGPDPFPVRTPPT
jgi:hypothetical protein